MGSYSAPLLYEVNSRVWLRELSERAGKPLTLSEIPEEEISRWAEMGFTHIWLMGVWQVGEEARRMAVEEWRGRWRVEFPESRESDVLGSPFAIQEYAVERTLGAPLELLVLKERFGRAGLKLIIDFVPNHLGIDSIEPRRYPARFVQADSAAEGTFPCETKFGRRYFAHGRDPYFPPWRDTVQIDYRTVEAQEAMASIAQTVSMFGEGLRCDMAMLLLPDIFHQTWREFPCVGNHQTERSFWSVAIPRIRQLQPNAELIAEAYWDRETDLQDAGFDYTYNKRVTDFILRGQEGDLVKFLQNCAPAYLRRSVHFLENHDEPRVASLLPIRRHKAAAALILFLPGMALLHDGQLEGRKRFSRIQIAKQPPEEPDPEITAFYRELLDKLKLTRIRRGRPRLLPAKDVIAVEWEGLDGEADIGLVNLGQTEVSYEYRTQEGRGMECIYSTDPGLIIHRDRVVIAAETAHIIRRRLA